MKRTKRPPRIFPESIPERRFKKKILRRIPLENERDFVTSVYRKEDSTFVRSSELSGKDVSRLRRLSKAIKHNRGFLQPVKLGLLGFIAGAALVFFAVLLHPLLTTSIESALESAFRARSELEGLRIRPFVPGISFNALTVADRDRPMRNLFEIRGARIELDINQLLRGRFVVRDFNAGEVSFGGERRGSGELPPNHPALRAASEPDSGEPAFRELAGDTVQTGIDQIVSLDPQTIVAAEVDRLSTPAVVDAQMALLTDEIANRRTQMAEIERELGAFRSSAETILQSDVQSIDSIERLITLYNESEQTVADARALLDRAGGVSADLSQSRGRVEEAVSAVSAAVERDISDIAERIPSASDIVSGPVASYIQPFIAAHVEPYTGYIATVQTALSWLQDRRAQAEERQGSTRGGRIVTYPATEYPRFLLQRAAAGAVSDSGRYRAELFSVSSNPDLTGEPVRAVYTQTRNGRSGQVESAFDTRTDAITPFEIDISLRNQPVAFSPTDAPFSFEALSGRYSLDARAELVRRGGAVQERISAEMTILPDELQFSSNGPIARRVQSVIDRAGFIQVRIAVPTPEDGRAVETNLDGPIREEVAAFLNEQRDIIVEQVEHEVRSRLDEQLARYESELEAVFSLYAETEQKVAEARRVAHRAIELRAEAEQRIARLRDDAEERARAEADAARREAERRAREEAEAAADRAEDRAREEAGRVIDSIRSPF